MFFQPDLAATITSNLNVPTWSEVGVSQPDLAATITNVVPRDGEYVQPEYAGIIRTAMRAVPGGELMQWLTMLLFSIGGGICLGSLAALMNSCPRRDPSAIITGLAFWTLTLGIPLFAVAGGPVYDRYLQVWIILLPVVWVIWCRWWP